MAENLPLILTDAGRNMIANAMTLKHVITITEMVLGSGDGDDTNGGKNNESYLPQGDQTALKNEVYRAEIMDSYMDETGKAAFTMLIPFDAGGWYVREVGLYAGDVLFAVGMYPATYKAPNESNVVEDLYIELALVVENADKVINFTIDPTAMLATKEYIANHYVLLSDYNKHLKDFGNPHKVTAEQVGAWAKDENKRVAIHHYNTGTTHTHSIGGSDTSYREIGQHSDKVITPKFETSRFWVSGLTFLGVGGRTTGAAMAYLQIHASGHDSGSSPKERTTASSELMRDGNLNGDFGRIWATVAVAPVKSWCYINEDGADITFKAMKFGRVIHANSGDHDLTFGRVDLIILEEEL